MPKITKLGQCFKELFKEVACYFETRYIPRYILHVKCQTSVEYERPN